MNKPLFEVGELVVLQSKYLPEHNGEYIVSQALFHDQKYIDPLTKLSVRFKSKIKTYGYILEGSSAAVIINNKDFSVAWCETSLRKKHHPSEDSFSTMMDKLKLGVSAWTTLTRKSTIEKISNKRLTS